MNQPRHNQFHGALNYCLSLPEQLSQPSETPCQAIRLLCELVREGANIKNLLSTNQPLVKQADQVVLSYASSIDNWRSQDCPLGMKDHCNILHFFLNLDGTYQDLLFFRGSDLTPEVICEFLKDWQGIDLLPLLPSAPALVVS